MQEGLSTSRRCQSSAACLVGAGKRFVIRYHSRTTTQPEKRISPQEAAELARAGLDLATVYQDIARTPDDFGAERGRLDGRSAQAFASQIGQPAGSAVYFAVDADFSAQQVQDFVLPYFEGVKAGMNEAAGGASAYTIGVYGSGLVCTLVRDNNALARWAWLAEATGWRGSADFDSWDVKQHVNTSALCNLDSDWERCEARDAFGQFRPIGFDVTQGDGVPMRVTASELNLRRLPTTAGNTPIARLPEGTLVRVLGPAVEPWLRVRATLGGGDVIGFASGRFLAPAADAAPAVAASAAVPAAMPAAAPIAAPAAVSVPAVHYRERDPQSRRDSAARRAQPLGETPRPSRDIAAVPATRVAQLGEIVRWLDAESSARYRRDRFTYCNVYAADFCYLADVYLPRTWWTDGALLRIARGDVPEPLYGQTVRELRADDLHAWLLEFGPSFGWRRVFDPTALQRAADDGGVGLICADRAAPGEPGHISVVVPETEDAKAARDADANVVLPLQSQAGARNFRYSTGGSAWWDDEATFRSFVFCVHE